MKQLTKAQIDAIRVVLATVGLDVKKMTVKRKFDCELDQRIADVQAMSFKTAGVKAAILKSLKLAKASRDWKAANPGSITELLAMFGFRLQDVQPWAGTRWECLRNALPSGQLALPSPQSFGAGWEPDEKVYVLADAAAPVKQIFCS